MNDLNLNNPSFIIILLSHFSLGFHQMQRKMMQFSGVHMLVRNYCYENSETIPCFQVSILIGIDSMGFKN